jgi:hypothetical protein
MKSVVLLLCGLFSLVVVAKLPIFRQIVYSNLNCQGPFAYLVAVDSSPYACAKDGICQPSVADGWSVLYDCVDTEEYLKNITDDYSGYDEWYDRACSQHLKQGILFNKLYDSKCFEEEIPGLFVELHCTESHQLEYSYECGPGCTLCKKTEDFPANCTQHHHYPSMSYTTRGC